MSDTKLLQIPLETAKLIDKVFLPSNPNKMRTSHPSVIEAVRHFKALLRNTRAFTPKQLAAEEINRELLEALKEVQWSNGGMCPQCAFGPKRGHQDRCVIGCAIAKAEGQ